MAKFCGNCGTQLDDNARVCGQCGTPVDGKQAKISGVKIVNLEKKKKIKKRIKRVFFLLLVVFITVVGIKVISNFTGKKGLVRSAMRAYKDYDIDTLVGLSSEMYYYGDENYVDEYFERSVGNGIDSFEASVGHSYKMSYEIQEMYDLSKRKQDELLKQIEYLYPNFDVDIIEKVSVADIEVTAKQGSKSIKRDVKIIMSKEEKVWKVLYLE